MANITPKRKLIIIGLIVLVVILILILAALLLVSRFDQISAWITSPTPTFTGTATVTRTPVPPTETPTPTVTLTSTPTVTSTKTLTPTATKLTDTRMGALVQYLYDEGIIHTLDGDYYLLDDYVNEWAQIDWYQWDRTGYEPSSFIIRVDAAWESASRTANWFDAGCGFVFSDSGEDTHHVVFLTMDGYVRPYRVKHNVGTILQTGFYDYFDVPADSAEIILVVEDQVMTVLVDRKKIVSFSDGSIQRGSLGLSLISGTNTGFGTRCEMTNIDYWEIE